VSSYSSLPALFRPTKGQNHRPSDKGGKVTPDPGAEALPPELVWPRSLCMFCGWWGPRDQWEAHKATPEHQIYYEPEVNF
jgi:hypothetical protein